MKHVPTAPSPWGWPDWRHGRALELYHSGRPASRRRDDPLVHQLLRYYELRQHAASYYLAAEQDEDLQSVAAAIELRESAPLLQRTLVEAYLLAGATSRKISRRLGIPPAVIDAYHDLCFDIRSRLRHPDLVVAVAILGSPAGADPQPRRHAAIKLLAYLAGPQPLAKLISPSRAGSGDQAGWTSALVGGVEALLEVEQYLAALAGDADSAAVARRMLEQSIARRGRERRPESLHPLEQHLKQVLDDFRWTVGAPRPGEGPPLLAELDQSAAELSCDEPMRVASGETLDNVDEILSLRLLPPRRREEGKQGDGDHG